MINKLRKLILTAAILLLTFLAWPQTGSANPPVLSEDQVKAAYIYNFAKFVQWSESAFYDSGTPLRICIAGSESLFQAIESLKDKTVQGRPLEVFRHSSSHKTSQCHILFIGEEGKRDFWEKRGKRIIPSVLTIADFDSFVSQGGIIEFIPQQSKIRFAVNISAANRAGIKLSSKLLKLAVFVKE